MGALDWLKDNGPDLFNIYTFVDDYNSRHDDEDTLNANNPWGPANAAAAGDLTQMINDGGEAYMAKPSSQRQYDQHVLTGNRYAASTGNLRDTSQATDRSASIWDGMIRAREDFLRQIPNQNPNIGQNLVQANSQSNFNQGDSVRDAMQSIGNIFTNNSNNNTSSPAVPANNSGYGQANWASP